MGTESGTKVSSVVGIVIVTGVLVAAGAIVAVRVAHLREEERRAEADRAQMRELERELRERFEARLPDVLAELDPRRAPMPREKRTQTPAELAEAKRLAHQHCQFLARAVEAFNLSPANVVGYPLALKELVKPPFGGPSFLTNGERDLIDPWGRPYRYEVGLRDDATAFVTILTTAPDDTPISQHGIGDNARPQK